MDDSETLDRSDRQVRRGARQVVYAPAIHETPKRLHQWRVYLWRVGLIIFVLLSGWIIFFSGWLNIRSVKLQGQHSLTNEVVAQDIELYLKQFPTQRNVLFLQPTELAQYIKERHSTAEKVNINRTLFLGIMVKINETQPALTWQSSGSVWLVGEDGRILRAVQAGDSSYGRVVDTAQIEVHEGDRVADVGFVNFARAVFRQSQERHITIEYLSIGETTREVLAKTKGGIIIKMATERGAGEQLDAYLSTVQEASKSGHTIKEYIDVRVVGKTYFK